MTCRILKVHTLSPLKMGYSDMFFQCVTSRIECFLEGHHDHEDQVAVLKKSRRREHQMNASLLEPP